MEMEKSKVLIQFLVIFRQSGDVLFFLYARRLRGYTATEAMAVYLLFLHKGSWVVYKNSNLANSVENCGKIGKVSVTCKITSPAS